ncbi:MAG: hypothetical protein C0598_09180 [Marinilabiliales bacterium]|nr:MAG: hypothetical protein C0598_09180 [Marinilabiliales bacterium]
MNKINKPNNITYILIIIFLVSVYSSCKKDENSNVLSKWKLIEQYSDPGDGSGDFNPVESDRTIEFMDNGIAVSNGSLCNMTLDANGTYSAIYNDSLIVTNDCDMENFTLHYQINSNVLIIWFPCIEGCAQKYAKID